MEELVILSGNSDKPITTSRKIAEVFEKDHKNVLRDIENLSEGMLNFEQMFHKTTYTHPQNGQTYPEYEMNRDGFSLLAMGFTGKKALEWKIKYIAAFNQMELALNSPEMQMAHGLLAAKELIEKKDKLIAELKPKADFFDAVAESKTAIEIGEVAKVLGNIGRNNLFNLLRQKGVLMSNNLPYQTYVDRGYFRVIEQKYTKSNGETCINIKTLVYQKGVDYIRKLIA